jgi:hypothetical protein
MRERVEEHILFAFEALGHLGPQRTRPETSK